MFEATFRARDLAVLAHTHGFTVWLYCARSICDVGGTGFFDGAVAMVAPRDIVVVSAQEGRQVFRLTKSTKPGQPGVSAVPLGPALR